MDMLSDLLLWIGNHYTGELALGATKIQEALWGASELLIVFFVLKIADLARARSGKGRIVWRYRLWGAILLANPVLLYVATARVHDGLMLANFTLLVYTAVAERKDVIRLGDEIMAYR